MTEENGKAKIEEKEACENDIDTDFNVPSLEPMEPDDSEPIPSVDTSSNNTIDEGIVLQEHSLLSAQKINAPVDANIANLDGSTQAAVVFRKHLQLIKNNESILAALQSNLVLSIHSPSIESDKSGLHEGLDRGSKSNLLNTRSKSELFEVAPVDAGFSAATLTNCVSFFEVISHPMTIHQGQVLVCLNAAPPVLSYVNGDYFLNTVIEDPDLNTTVARLEVNCDVSEAARFSTLLKNPYMSCMNPNSVILIKNPIFKHDSSGKHLSICAMARDVIFRDHSALTGTKIPVEIIDSEDGSKVNISRKSDYLSDDKMTTITGEEKLARDEWRDLGNDFTVRRMHLQAYFAYTIALKFNPLCVELAAAQGASLISLGLFSAALKIVDLVLQNDPFNIGLILRRTHCLWGIGQLDEANKYLRTCLESFLSVEKQILDQDLIRKTMLIQKTISKTEKIIRQRETPELLDEEVFFQNQTHLFHYEPEYYTPITIIPSSDPSGSSNCEKMAVVNQSCPAGKILAITKAFSVVIQEEETETSPASLCDALINRTKQKMLIENPTESEIYQPSNQNVTITEDGTETLMEKSIKLCERFSYKSCTYHKTGIESTVERNNYNNVSSFSRSTIQGVWTFPANIRHACVGGNAIWYICGNIMFIRAIRNIKEGEEITMPHVDPMKPLEYRIKFLQRKGIECSCPLCHFERSESETTKAKRSELLKERLSFQALSDNDTLKETSYSELQRLKLRLEDLETLRSAYSKLNFPIVEPLSSMGLYLMKAGNYEGAINAFERAFYVVDNTTSIFILVDLSFLLSYCYMAKRKKSDKNRSKKWFNALKSYVKLSYGCLSPVKNKFKEEFDYLRRKGIIL